MKLLFNCFFEMTFEQLGFAIFRFKNLTEVEKWFKRIFSSFFVRKFKKKSRLYSRQGFKTALLQNLGLIFCRSYWFLKVKKLTVNAKTSQRSIHGNMNRGYGFEPKNNLYKAYKNTLECIRQYETWFIYTAIKNNLKIYTNLLE